MPGELRSKRSKICEIGPKMDRFMKSNENLEIFDKNLYGKINFYPFLLKISGISALF